MSDLDHLIQRWLAGDEQAAEALYNRYRTWVFQLAYGILGQSDDAEEAMQDALTYALTHIRNYDPQRAQFNTWLHTITISRCRDRQRRKRLPQLSLRFWLDKGQDAVDPTAGFETQIIHAETQ